MAFDPLDPDINTAYNYGYDALGNLVRDEREQIANIEWTVAGKVRSVARTTGSGLKPLQFAYGASGQRIMKQVGEPGTDAGAYREHYIRDAQGNIMATYRYTNETSVGVSLLLNERPIYGSSRLGSYTKTMQLYNAQAITSNPPPSNIIQRPHLRYELTDHLGNVAAVVTGRLLPSQSLAPYEADLVSAQGYEPFGSLLPGRNYSSNAYAHGFNGMRKDDEIHGATGTSYDFGARLYDPRIGRWFSTDPLASKYPETSPYAFGLNNPIFFVDYDGRDIVLYYVNTCGEKKPLITLVTSAVTSEFCLYAHQVPAELQPTVEKVSEFGVRHKLAQSFWERAAEFGIEIADPDAFIVSIGGSAIGLTGQVLGLEVVCFQEGPNEGEAHAFTVESKPFENFGVNLGVGIEVGAGEFEPPRSCPQEEGSAQNYAGGGFEIGVGVGVAGGTLGVPTNMHGAPILGADGGWTTLTVGCSGGGLPDVDVGAYGASTVTTHEGGLFNCP